MTPPVCLTGASGFIGQRVVERLVALDVADVTLLVRKTSRLGPRPSHSSWRSLAVDLAADALPGDAISPGSVVMHLAAATGSADARTIQSVNVDATERLLEAARGGGAGHVVFVSSVAAGYKDQRWAAYAKSKAAAERLVARAGIPYTIVRPTMVFGQGSPNQRALERLATFALPLMVGTGHVRVQPIHVDDLADTLLHIAAAGPAVSGPVTVGGPSIVTLLELFAAIRRARGLPAREPLSLPLEAVRRALALLAAATGSHLPVSAGQFVAFANDSVADAPPDGMRFPAPRISLDAMLMPEQGR